MKRFAFATICAVGLTLSVGVEVASAQPPPPGVSYARPPAYSPYLNLLRSGNSAGVNYYGLVRPEIQFRQSIQNLSTQVDANAQAIGNLATTGNGQSATGHSTQFMNLGGYFLGNSGGGMSGGSRAGTIGGSARRR
jgi:hypothetical protein